MINAAGMVTAIVNVAHELSFRAFTTTSASPASAVMMIKRMANPVAIPAVELMCFAARRVRDRPFSLTEAKRITIS